MQEASAVSVANLAFRACASLPFWSWNEPLDEPEDAAAAEVAAGAATVVVVASSSSEQSSVEVAAAAVLVAAGAAAADELALEEPVLEPEDDEPLMFWRPGSDVMSVSCEPSAMGPLGLAAHEPAGESGVVWPKGMVPAAPTASPPTNVCWFAPWNWHWNRPFSSEFFGACWQYGTATELGCQTESV